MAISNVPWSSVSESDYADAADFCRACLIDTNRAGEPKSKANCKLPVRMPNGGPVNRNAVHAAAVALAGGRSPMSVSSEDRASAARRLIRLYGELEEDAPPSLLAMVSPSR